MQKYTIKLDGKIRGNFSVDTADLPVENDKVLIRVTFAKLWNVHYARVSIDETY